MKNIIISANESAMRICRQLMLTELSSMDGRALEAAARGCCAWLQGFAGADAHLDAAAGELSGRIWDAGLAMAASPDHFPEADVIYAHLALYRVAYGPTVQPSDYSKAEKCDMLASSLLSRTAGKYSASDEKSIVLMHIAAHLYCYVVPEDLEGDDTLEYMRATAQNWEHDVHADPDILLRRLCALEAADGLFGEWRPVLPAASRLASAGGLAPLCSILARRLDDPAALADACAALERHLSLSQDIAAAASLLEGLSALRLLTEEGAALNCA